jgi:hypothetical protein
MRSMSHPAAALAAAASAAAGAIHAAAAGSHADLTTLSRLFAVAAVAQIAWAAAVLWRRSPVVVFAGVAVHVAAFATWAASRSVGVGVGGIEGLQGGETINFADVLAAGLAVVASVSGIASLRAAGGPRWLRTVVPALVGVIAVVTVPAVATPHQHGSQHHGEGQAPSGSQHHGGDGEAPNDSQHHDGDGQAPSDSQGDGGDHHHTSESAPHDH